jgi:pSer/pThr/pTyr-binding forkhead associated (FHA) protein
MPGVLTVREAGAERRVVFDTRAIVGRDPDCTLVLESRSVSRKHAIVERTANGWTVHDLSSANGLFVEGKRVSEAPLAPGTSLRFGDVEATFEGDGPARTTSAERLAASLSVAPARSTRPVAVVVVTSLAVLALVAATVWARYCDHAPKPGTSTSAPAERR